MPQTRTDVKLTDTLEEVLQPVKEAVQNLITNETIAQLLNNLEGKLFKKLTEQAKEISDLKSRCNHLEGRVTILENLANCERLKLVISNSTGGDYASGLTMFHLKKEKPQ